MLVSAAHGHSCHPDWPYRAKKVDIMSISRYTVVEVMCDQEGCDDSEDDIGVSVATLRKWATAHGWFCVRGIDLCPKHAAVRAEVPTALRKGYEDYDNEAE